MKVAQTESFDVLVQQDEVPQEEGEEPEEEEIEEQLQEEPKPPTLVELEPESPSSLSDDEKPLKTRQKRKKQKVNDEWDLPPIPKDFPKELLKNGQFIVKSKELSELFSKFYNVQCEVCDDKPKFKDFKILLKHYATEKHSESPFVSCCGLKLYKYRRALFHMARHIQPEEFQCNICGFIVSRPEFLENHKKTHLPEDHKPHACPHCPKHFVWKYAFDIHVATHKPIEERKVYKCVQCNKTYDTPGGLSTHKKVVHQASNEKIQYICNICGKPFAQRTGLNEHMNTIHQDNRERTQLQCAECGAWLMNKRCLKTHMLLHNGVDHKCEKCEYTTKKKTLLNRHYVTHHSTGPPAFSCDQCNKKFKLKRALTVHKEAAHSSNAKSYQCNFCPRKFVSPSNFYSHRKNMHPEELAKLREKEAQEKKSKRIAAGLESDAEEPTITIIHEPELNLSDGNTQTFIIQME